MHERQNTVLIELGEGALRAAGRAGRALDFDPTKHKRKPKGRKGGGEFAEKPGGRAVPPARKKGGKFDLPPRVTGREDPSSMTDDELQSHYRALMQRNQDAPSEATYKAVSALAAEFEKRGFKRSAKGWTKRRLNEALSELEEVAMAVPLRGRRTIDFNPQLHPRDRLGQFRQHLGGILQAGRGSEARLPHGVTVRRTLGGLEVQREGREPKRFAGETGAAAEALFLHDEEAIKRGADPGRVRSVLRRDLEKARASSDETMDMDKIDERITDVYRARMAGQTPGRPAVAGRKRRMPRGFAENVLGSFEAIRGMPRRPLRSVGSLEDERRAQRVIAGIEGGALKGRRRPDPSSPLPSQQVIALADELSRRAQMATDPEEREALRRESLRARTDAERMRRGLGAGPADELTLRRATKRTRQLSARPTALAAAEIEEAVWNPLRHPRTLKGRKGGGRFRDVLDQLTAPATGISVEPVDGRWALRQGRRDARQDPRRRALHGRAYSGSYGTRKEAELAAIGMNAARARADADRRRRGETRLPGRATPGSDIFDKVATFVTYSNGGWTPDLEVALDKDGKAIAWNTDDPEFLTPWKTEGAEAAYRRGEEAVARADAARYTQQTLKGRATPDPNRHQHLEIRRWNSVMRRRDALIADADALDARAKAAPTEGAALDLRNAAKAKRREAQDVLEILDRGRATPGTDDTPLWDEYGNLDYGYRWDEEAQDYVPRPGELAAERRARSAGEEKQVEFERDRHFEGLPGRATPGAAASKFAPVAAKLKAGEKKPMGELPDGTVIATPEGRIAIIRTGLGQKTYDDKTYVVAQDIGSGQMFEPPALASADAVVDRPEGDEDGRGRAGDGRAAGGGAGAGGAGATVPGSRPGGRAAAGAVQAGREGHGRVQAARRPVGGEPGGDAGQGRRGDRAPPVGQGEEERDPRADRPRPGARGADQGADLRRTSRRR